jgi:hypothetical protein
MRSLTYMTFRNKMPLTYNNDSQLVGSSVLKCGKRSVLNADLTGTFPETRNISSFAKADQNSVHEKI